MSDKYKNGKIYTIRYKNDDSLIYVGLTVQPLFKRWHQHKSRVNNKEYNTLVYIKIRETNIEDWYIELYEEFSCENKEQLNKREGQIIREIGTLNKKISGRKYNEWYKDNQNKILEKQKEKYEDNKSKISEQHKENRLNDKEAMKEYFNKIKEYNEEYYKKYYIRNEKKESKQTQQIT